MSDSRDENPLQFLSRLEISEADNDVRNIHSMLKMENLISGMELRIFKIRPGVAGIIAGEVSAMTKNYVSVDMYQTDADRQAKIQNTAIVEKSHIDKKDLSIGDHVAIRYFADGSKMGNVIDLVEDSEWVISIGGITDEYPDLRDIVLKMFSDASHRGTKMIPDRDIPVILQSAVKDFCEPRGFEMDGDSSANINVKRVFTSQVKKNEIAVHQSSLCVNAYNENPRKNEKHQANRTIFSSSAVTASMFPAPGGTGGPRA